MVNDTRAAYQLERVLSDVMASTLANPSEWLIQALGGTKSTAGIRVNYRSAMSIAYVYAAQQIISGDVASLPFDAKVREADEDLILDRNQPVYWLMNGDANESMSGYLFRETITHWALMFGNGMAYVLRDNMERPTQLIPACPGDLTVERLDGQVVYHNREMDETFAQRDILHVRGLGDDMMGHPLIQLAKNSFGMSLAQDAHGAQNWKNGASPRIILKHPKPLNAQQAAELLERFEKRHSEPGKPALAAGGLEIEVVPTSNSDAQWIESRKQIITEVAAWYNLPPHKLGDSTRVGYNGVAAENQAYITQTLRRWLKRWESEAGRKLLAPRQYRSFAVVLSHDPKPLTDTDTAAITDEVTKQVAAELITFNEGRRRLGYPRVEGGDVRQNPNTSSPSLPADPPAMEPPEAPAAASIDRQPFVAMVADRLEVMAGVMVSQAATKRKKQQPIPDDWTTTWTDRTPGYVASCMQAAGAVFEVMPLESVTATVGEWSMAAAYGEVLLPSPAELAEQIIGEQKCMS